MIRSTYVASLALLFSVTQIASAAQSPKSDDPKVGTKVVVMGCLLQGTDEDSFVLLNVTERPVVDNTITMPAPASSIYWLDTNEGLKERVGSVVEVTGTVELLDEKTPRARGTITVVADPKARTKDVTVTTPEGAVRAEVIDPSKPKPGTPTKQQVSRPVYTLAVERVHTALAMPAGKSCK